jgi:hypothetical protein
LSIDGRPVGSGRSVTVSPRRLATFADGAHTLLVTGARASARSQLQLAPCDLALRLNGGPGQATALSSFDLLGTRTVYNDVVVTITPHNITLTNLPDQTGVVGVTLLAAALSGRPESATLVARERGLPGLARASTPVTWLR